MKWYRWLGVILFALAGIAGILWGIMAPEGLCDEGVCVTTLGRIMMCGFSVLFSVAGIVIVCAFGDADHE